MLLKVLKAKLHQATVTETELGYHGSVTIDRDLMDAVGLLPYEQILIANCNSGQRGESYVIEGERGGGEIKMNGALARLAQKGDRVIILAFGYAHEKEVKDIHPRVAILNQKNEITEQFSSDIE